MPESQPPITLQGISLDELATSTKVSVDLWVGLEQNDLSRWPSGIKDGADFVIPTMN